MKRALLSAAVFAWLIAAPPSQAQLSCPGDPPLRIEKGVYSNPAFHLTNAEGDDWYRQIRAVCAWGATADPLPIYLTQAEADALYAPIGDGGGGGSADTDDQTAAQVPITDAGSYYTGTNVEAALQEVGPTMTDARTPLAHTQAASTITDFSTALRAITDPLYPFLAGRTGGETVYGGTGTADKLNLFADAADTAGPSVVLGGSTAGNGLAGKVLATSGNTYTTLDVGNTGVSIDAWGGPGPYHYTQIRADSTGRLQLNWSGDTFDSYIRGDQTNGNLKFDLLAPDLSTHRLLTFAADTGDFTIAGGGRFVGALVGNADTATSATTATTANDLACTDCIGATEIATLAPADAGLGNVTNDQQTKSAIVPNTPPSPGQLPIGNAGGTAYAPQTLSGDCTVTSAGVVTCAKVNGVAYSASPSTDTVPTITAANTATYKAIPDCDDAAGQHLNYDTTLHVWICGTTGGMTVPGSGTEVMVRSSGTALGAASGSAVDGSGNVTLGGSQFKLFASNTTWFTDDATFAGTTHNLLISTAGGIANAKGVVARRYVAYDGTNAFTLTPGGANIMSVRNNVDNGYGGIYAGYDIQLFSSGNRLAIFNSTINALALARGQSLTWSGSTTEAYTGTTGMGLASPADGTLRLDGGNFSAAGDAASTTRVLRNSTTNATATELFLNGSSTRMALANDTTWTFDCLVTARRTDADNESAAYRLVGAIDRNGNAASTALVGTVTQTVIAEDTAAWDATATADTTNGALILTVTGEASKTIRWVANCRDVETTG